MTQSDLLETYGSKVVPLLKEKFKYKNLHQIPKIVKVTVSIGLGEVVQNPKVIDAATEQLAAIAGQRPVVTRAKKSIAGFKLREGMPIGCMVTLRQKRMWNFLDKLLHVAMPRIRDFRGVSPRSFDGRGNYSLGIQEQLIFLEIDFDQIDKVRGLNIALTTTANTDEEARQLMQGLGFPFRN
ncbi:MAG: 50S ribosomal protein L5 [Deltaproteobacteria bacterium]|jgi:large subunit ribosomal protein L5|nr:50S ribosomal protein L5 [Deltaproteobacteria bacterium]MDP7158793.1 50S ribosomal protein L5 [SAR324 cluster bacterium]MDP7318592.1 50S ribosomal protein L5 [SAR324 cluster bacterium]MDP7629839.1 50S ribosomal protein L5 [SAR324 cluster bacterium]